MKFRPVNTDNNLLKVASSPFTHNKKSTSQIMFWVVLAAIPGIAVQTYLFGSGTLFQILLAIITAWLAESAAIALKKQLVTPYLKDNSALVTGLLLGISLPPLAPWWLIVLGTFFAIIIAKHLYGGLGQNPFNPAMVGYVVLLISFPVQMTSWIPPASLQMFSLAPWDSLMVIFTGHTPDGSTLFQLQQGIDGLSQATPLDSFKTGRLTHDINEVLQQPILQGTLGGIGWQWVNVAYLIGGLIMLNRKIISWQIPTAFILSLAACALLSWLIDPARYSPPLLQIFSGATMLGAFFIATDPVSASTTPKGRLIYGAIIGFLIWIIRVYGGYPDAVAFAVLLANICVPLIDHYTQPRVYGHQ
ncbi:electron transport complex subunit RsxD [Xenorhabdus szentirmaii]|uniref:Ion-translocating oxidoreductase complex subunit D n=2 Tax=Xenorhabdus szentirmaii TaxID=290112 RepID=W1IS00_9GAMM|nr:MULTISPECIES: electron transport complex subunit RsxD [Xenorhabdus]MBD2781536.1 electron transport complex subunit RsxD [Xenorhabdus sp. 38]MBD2792728.1 electron transport complex subunit RsxD [Xenorhabdus sp. CUL]MBD2800734.1 electron transport complex subunit RsxD [Xenorhabdus sp. M]MBD2821245.1 electron transport complex subunit RsxD [Xenorhabdus sp. 42]PHM32534.1 Na-translocating NADH-quinone reductase subunit B [Xenorhabdus szentirmaii DSM 16338]